MCVRAINLRNFCSYVYFMMLLPLDFNIFLSEDPCGDGKPALISNSATGEISSPNYPNPYPNRADCQWHIQSISGHAVQLLFLEFDLENRSDDMMLYIVAYCSYISNLTQGCVYDDFIQKDRIVE